MGVNSKSETRAIPPKSLGTNSYQSMASMVLALWPHLFFLLCNTNFRIEAFNPSRRFGFVHNHRSVPSSLFRERKGQLLPVTTATKNDNNNVSTPSSDAADKIQNRPWNVLRFVSQSSKFIRPPSLPEIIGGVTGKKNVRKVMPGEVLWSLSTKNFFIFSPLDDVVMGGASYSTMDNKSGLWKGVVINANNGGFVGIRSTPFTDSAILDMSNCKGIVLKVRTSKEVRSENDGSNKIDNRERRYKFVVRDAIDFNGICWTTEFDVQSSSRNTIDIRIPFAKQIPTLFAKIIRGKIFDVTNVVGFQVAYSKFEYDGRLNSKFQPGVFELQLLELKSF